MHSQGGWHEGPYRECVSVSEHLKSECVSVSASFQFEFVTWYFQQLDIMLKETHLICHQTCAAHENVHLWVQSCLQTFFMKKCFHFQNECKWFNDFSLRCPNEVCQCVRQNFNRVCQCVSPNFSADRAPRVTPPFLHHITLCDAKYSHYEHINHNK